MNSLLVTFDGVYWYMCSRQGMKDAMNGCACDYCSVYRLLALAGF